MRAAHTYRHDRRRSSQVAGFPMAAAPPQRRKRELTDVERHKRMLEPIAQLMLMTGERSQVPRYRAVRKMVHYLLASEMHAKVPRHLRGSWRSWPTDIGRSVA